MKKYKDGEINIVITEKDTKVNITDNTKQLHIVLAISALFDMLSPSFRKMILTKLETLIK